MRSFFLGLCLFLSFASTTIANEPPATELLVSDPPVKADYVEANFTKFLLFFTTYGYHAPNITPSRMTEIYREIIAERGDLDSMRLQWRIYNTIFKEVNDPYAEFFPKIDPVNLFGPAFNATEEATPVVEVFGIGARIGFDMNKRLYVIGGLNETGAGYRAGIRPGDYILEIDGVNVQPHLPRSIMMAPTDIGTKAVIDRITNTEKSVVRLTLLRNGVRIKIAVQRDSIFPERVWMTSHNGIVHVVIADFMQNMVDEFIRDLLALNRREHIRGIVLDFRDNGGGLTNNALKLLSLFSKPGDVIMTHTKRDGQFTENVAAHPTPILDIPMVVIIDGYSASASEIVAGTLQSNDRLIGVVGQKSFGKGTEQTMFALVDGSYIKFTVHTFQVGNAHVEINGIGVTPEYPEQVDNDLITRTHVQLLSNPAIDPALKRALDLFR